MRERFEGPAEVAGEKAGCGDGARVGLDLDGAAAAGSRDGFPDQLAFLVFGPAADRGAADTRPLMGGVQPHPAVERAEFGSSPANRLRQTLHDQNYFPAESRPRQSDSGCAIAEPGKRALFISDRRGSGPGQPLSFRGSGTDAGAEEPYRP